MSVQQAVNQQQPVTKPSASILPLQKSKPKTKMEEYNWFLYGLPKVGKTKFAAGFPNSLICTFGAGDIPKHLECHYKLINNYNEAMEVFGALRDLSSHPFRTIVIDTVDVFVDMVREQICLENSPDPFKPV